MSNLKWNSETRLEESSKALNNKVFEFDDETNYVIENLDKLDKLLNDLMKCDLK
jgi:hypothetical protein